MEDKSPEAIGELARQQLAEILRLMQLTAEAKVTEATESQIVLDLQGGEDQGILIGQQGETLNALQLLVSIITNKLAGTRYRILLDASGYRSRRARALRLRALEVAEQVKATGKEALLESLKAHERRIVHLALANDPDVYTYSEGEGEHRRLVISPKE